MHEVLAVLTTNISAWNVTAYSDMHGIESEYTHPMSPSLFTFSHEQYKLGIKEHYGSTVMKSAVFVGPCHHGMACPQVADGGTTSNMEGSCE